MDPLESLGALDAIRLSDWIEAAGISRSTAYELLKLLQIEPEARRVPSSRKPVSHLSGEQMGTLAPWVAELKRGATLPQLRERLGRNDNVRDDGPGQSDIVPVDQLTAVLAAIVSQQQAAPPADPLRTAKALAEAAELGVALSTAELAGVLGMAVGTVRGLADGHCPRPGFTLRREKAGNAVWWMVERPGRSDSVPADLRAISGQRSVGFAQVLDVQAVRLPNW